MANRDIIDGVARTPVLNYQSEQKYTQNYKRKLRPSMTSGHIIKLPFDATAVTNAEGQLPNGNSHVSHGEDTIATNLT